LRLKIFALLLFFQILILYTDTYSQPKKHSWKFKKNPVWVDEFDNQNNKLDSTKWTMQTGGEGWGNNELQYYTDGDNIKIDSGVLKIIAKNETIKNNNYTSSRIITRNKAGWKYGRFEIRAILPSGKGVWPAFWLLPDLKRNSSDIENGEIDIMEFVGFEPDVIHFSVHTKFNNSILGNEKAERIKIKNASCKFHTYRMDWTPYGIRGYVNGKKYFEYLNNGKGHKYWPFDEKFFLIINLAIGGDWGGLKGIDKNIFPATMEIDYVKIYEFIK